MKEPKRVLYVNTEIFPYLPESEISIVGRYLPQGTQELGKEIRTFMPRYGCINERKNQLHEVIRLSGMNIVINEVDHPLVIKVASISSARMQVYFIDNDEYFHRKFIFNDADGLFFNDNDERAIFFTRGILETVKKLRWKPDIIHCQGWMSYLIPLYLKRTYAKDPIFTESKIVLSLYNDNIENYRFNPEIRAKINMPGIKNKDTDILKDPNGINLAKLAIQYSNAIIRGSKDINRDLEDYIKNLKLPVLEYVEIDHPNGTYIKIYNDFYDKILDNGH